MNFLQSILRAPVFEDQEKTRVASLLNSVLLASFVSTLMFITISGLIFREARDRLYLALIPLPILIILKFLLHQGYSRAVGVTLILLLWSVAAVANFTAGGVRAPNFAAFIIPILTAGLTLGRRAGMGLALLTVGLGVIFLYGEGQGWLPPLRIYSPTATLFLHSAFILVAILLLNIAIANIQNTNAHLYQNEKILAEKNAALQHEIEERTRVELAQRESEAKYQLLFESNPYPLFVIDSETLRYLAVNDAVVHLLGYSHEEFLNMTAFDLRLPEDFPQVIQRQARFSQTPTYFSPIGVSRYQKKDGSVVSVEITAHSITYMGRRAAMVAAYNLTERLQAEEALRVSEEQYRLLFEVNPYPLFIIDPETLRYLAVNDAAVGLMGYSHDEFMAMTLKEVRAPEELELLLQQQQQYLRDPWNFGRIGMSSFKKKDGSILYAAVDSHSINYNGIKAVMSTAYDLTSRVQAEEALHRSQEMFRTIFHSVPVGIGISTIEDGRTLEVNDFLVEMMGYDREEMIHQPTSLTWLVPEARAEMVRGLQQQGSVKNMEVQWRTKSGGIRDILISVELIELLDGQPCTLGMAIDITERKRAEQERIDLEARHAALELKERFISQVSHEVRTPLSIILAAKEALEHYYDRMGPERRQEHFEKIDREVRFMADMIEEVLTVSRARAGKLQCKPSSLDIIDTCKKIIDQMQATDTGRHHFIFTADLQLQHLDIDGRLLRHILVNLLSNAAKYSPAGSEIRLNLSQDGQDFIIQVRDQGIGIPAKDQAALFEPFHRAHNASDIRGTGLGLTIVKESAEACKGTVAFESEEGKGTTFTVRLPAYALT